MANAILRVRCPDRTGIIAALSDFVFRHGGNILDLDQHTVLTREPDGSISGITDVSFTPHLPTLIEQMFTGVRPEARGRGLGKWIKAAMLEKIRAEHAQAEWMITGNAESNGPMLSINHRLGFKEYRAAAVYQLSRDRLAEVVARGKEQP